MAHPHQTAQFAGQLRLAALRLNELIEAAEELRLLNTAEKLLDINLELLQVRLELLQTLPGVRRALQDLQPRRPDCQDELPF